MQARNTPIDNHHGPIRKGSGKACLFLLAIMLGGGATPGDAQENLLELTETIPGAAYLKFHLPAGPWSVHVVRLDRKETDWEIGTVLAGGNVCGLEPLSELVAPIHWEGKLIAAVNGDFFQQHGAGAGDPRGLMIKDGELVSAASGGEVFWMDDRYRPRVESVHSRLSVTWPGGREEPIGLNEPLRHDRPALYTPAYGRSTETSNSALNCEMVLEPCEGSPWLPLRLGQRIVARVRERDEFGSTPLDPGTMVLSVPMGLVDRRLEAGIGSKLIFEVDTQPSLRGVNDAIGGGPLLVNHGWRATTARPPKTGSQAYSVRSKWERHPRTAIGWNGAYLYLLEVDGRNPGFSEGMTLHELSTFMTRILRCQKAINLDGGGSATLWYDGEVRNYPSDWGERNVANGLVIRRKGARREPPHRTAQR